jgi:hypothetical protein
MTYTSRFFFAAICALGVAANASTIEIQLVDVDIEYDSSTGEINDSGDFAGEDALAGIFFFLDGSPVGSLMSPPEVLSLDLSIPGVFGIDPSGDSVLSAAGGSLELSTPGLILDLDLAEVEVVYLPLSVGPDLFEFVFAGTVGTIAGQDLPFDLDLEDPVTVTFSTQASSLTSSSTEVLTFAASGTGELTGELDLTPDDEVPEPTAVALIALAAGLLAARARRS